MTCHCSAINCKNSQRKTPTLKCFHCPKDKDRCAKWVQNSRRQDLKNKPLAYCLRNIVFCQEHFEDSNFMNEKRDKLTWFAAPTLFNIPNPPVLSLPRRPILKYELPTKQDMSLGPSNLPKVVCNHRPMSTNFAIEVLCDLRLMACNEPRLNCRWFAMNMAAENFYEQRPKVPMNRGLPKVQTNSRHPKVPMNGCRKFRQMASESSNERRSKVPTNGGRNFRRMAA